jgi:hypothetical protein
MPSRSRFKTSTFTCGSPSSPRFEFDVHFDQCADALRRDRKLWQRDAFDRALRWARASRGDCSLARLSRGGHENRAWELRGRCVTSTT